MYDIIIIGAGPAGLSAAIYGQRAGKQTLVLEERSFGGQIVNTPEVENYPGIAKISGMEFANALYKQAVDLGAEVQYKQVASIEEQGSSKVVHTSKESFTGHAIILATGAKNRLMGIDGEQKLTGSGVSYCATCDGAFFRGRKVAVVGGGNTALEDAETLSGICEKVFLVHRRDAFRGDGVMVNRIKEKANVEMVLDSIPVSVPGDMMVSGLKIKNVKTGEENTLDVNGVFVAIGQVPDNEKYKKLVTLDEKGYIVAGEDCTTKTPGIFAAGDCRTKKVRQLTTAAADGAVAALAAVDYIRKE